MIKKRRNNGQIANQLANRRKSASYLSGYGCCYEVGRFILRH
uniref:Uncharacterized protein n=1 Tax=Anguilla anguilla TaxID=7936 RepID=A0A0E9SAL5_ANGAN